MLDVKLCFLCFELSKFREMESKYEACKETAKGVVCKST